MTLARQRILDDSLLDSAIFAFQWNDDVLEGLHSTALASFFKGECVEVEMFVGRASSETFVDFDRLLIDASNAVRPGDFNFANRLFAVAESQDGSAQGSVRAFAFLATSFRLRIRNLEILVAEKRLRTFVVILGH